jgi:hypothetical protein
LQQPAWDTVPSSLAETNVPWAVRKDTTTTPLFIAKIKKAKKRKMSLGKILSRFYLFVKGWAVVPLWASKSKCESESGGQEENSFIRTGMLLARWVFFKMCLQLRLLLLLLCSCGINEEKI